MSAPTTPPTLSTTKTVRDFGQPDGLFRSCMNVIRHSHTKGQLLRTFFIISGVFSDKIMYAELLTQFYVTTECLDLILLESESEIASSVLNSELGKYKGFCNDYATDLEHLLGPDHLRIINSYKSEAAIKYIKTLKENNAKVELRDASLLAGIFILWGPMIIGGGAMLYPRVKKAYGELACSTFTLFIGSGREKRKREFIDFFDSVGERMEEEEFNKVVELCGEYMRMNNEMMVQVKRRPWWVKWGAGLGISLACGAVYVYVKKKKT